MAGPPRTDVPIGAYTYTVTSTCEGRRGASCPRPDGEAESAHRALPRLDPVRAPPPMPSMYGSHPAAEYSPIYAQYGLDPRCRPDHYAVTDTYWRWSRETLIGPRRVLRNGPLAPPVVHPARVVGLAVSWLRGGLAHRVLHGATDRTSCSARRGVYGAAATIAEGAATGGEAPTSGRGRAGGDAPPRPSRRPARAPARRRDPRTCRTGGRPRRRAPARYTRAR